MKISYFYILPDFQHQTDKSTFVSTSRLGYNNKIQKMREIRRLFAYFYLIKGNQLFYCFHIFFQLVFNFHGWIFKCDCFNFIVLCSCFVYCLYMYISYVGFKSSLELVLYIVSFLPTLNNISYLGVIKGVQNFTPVLKIHTPGGTPDCTKITNSFLMISYYCCAQFKIIFVYFIPGVNGLARVGCYLHPGN